METKLVRIAEISATTKHPIFTSVYHLINEDMLKQCHKELDGSKAVGIDKVTKDEYGKNLDRNIKDLVQRLKNKSFKPLPSLRVYIPKANGKKRPLGIASYEDKIVQMAVKKILGAIYEPRFLNCMYGFRPNRGCHEAIKEIYQRISYGKISYIVDADIKGFFDHIDHEWMMKFLEWNIQDKNLLWLIRKYLKAGIMEQGKFEPTEEGSAQGSVMSPMLANIYMHHVLTLWFKLVVKKEMQGECFLVNFADDFVAGFQYMLFGCQLNPVALGKKLRERNAKSLADAFQRWNGGRCVSTENIGNGGLGKSGFQREPIFAPLPIGHQFPDAKFCIHKDHSLLNKALYRSVEV